MLSQIIYEITEPLLTSSLGRLFLFGFERVPPDKLGA